MQAVQGVVALAPEELRLECRAAVDWDDLDRILGTEEAVDEVADIDQLAAKCLDGPVALVAVADVAGCFVEVRLVGLDQLFEARADHPLQNLLQQAKVDGCFADFKECVDAFGERWRHLGVVD